MGYKEALVSAFEEVPRWEDVNKIPTLNKVKKQVNDITVVLYFKALKSVLLHLDEGVLGDWSM